MTVQVVVQIISARASTRKIWLKQNQVLKIGRTQWADLAIDEDSLLADVHFSLECDQSNCRITDLSRTPGTYVNGVRISERILDDGDVIQAGQTEFRVGIADKPAASVETEVLKPAPQTARSVRIDPAHLAYDQLPTAAGLIMFTGQAASPSELARTMAERCPMYLVINYGQLPLTAPQDNPEGDLLAGMSDVIRSRHALHLVGEGEGRDLFGTLDRFWGADSITAVFSKLETPELADQLRHAAPSYLSAGLLRHQLAAAPAAFARQLVSGVQAVLVESEPRGQWVVFANPDHVRSWQDAGFLSPPRDG